MNSNNKSWKKLSSLQSKAISKQKPSIQNIANDKAKPKKKENADKSEDESDDDDDDDDEEDNDEEMSDQEDEETNNKETPVNDTENIEHKLISDEFITAEEIKNHFIQLWNTESKAMKNLLGSYKIPDGLKKVTTPEIFFVDLVMVTPVKFRPVSYVLV